MFSLRMVQKQIHEIELHHTMEPRRQIAKELIELAMRSDCLRNLQKRLVSAMQQIGLRGRRGLIVHNV